MKKVLLTGATGFIGNYCLPLLLADGYEVHAVSSRVETFDTLPEVRWHRTDLLDSGRVSELMAKVQPTHLLHLAWYAEPGKYGTSLENFRWVKASLDLFQAFASCDGHRVVMAGSCAEYDWQHAGLCSEKTTPLVPSTLYGACKHSLHVMLNAFARQNGLSAAWGRIFFLYGPHEHPERLIASVIRALLRNEPARCSHGNQIRDFLCTEDAAAAFVALLNSEVDGAVNIASGQAVSLQEIVYKVAEKLDRPDLVQLGAVPAPQNDPLFLVADVNRLRSDVGWSPQYDLDQGLERTISWWRHTLRQSRADHLSAFIN